MMDFSVISLCLTSLELVSITTYNQFINYTHLLKINISNMKCSMTNLDKCSSQEIKRKQISVGGRNGKHKRSQRDSDIFTCLVFRNGAQPEVQGGSPRFSLSAAFLEEKHRIQVGNFSSWPRCSWPGRFQAGRGREARAPFVRCLEVFSLSVSSALASRMCNVKLPVHTWFLGTRLTRSFHLVHFK